MILSPKVQEYCKSKGIVFAEAEDAAGAWLHIATNPSINGEISSFHALSFVRQRY